jgi:hypothetical protein
VKYTVVVTGTAPVWAHIVVEADSEAAAREKASDSDPRFTADWQMSDGGNGVNDWSVEEVMDENNDAVEEEEEPVAAHEPHSSDCGVWVHEPCNCIMGHVEIE